ncbi:MAG: flagellar basal body-associated protein FliL [Methylobacteriaceae bacterium]|nr:flagellar basal body-associated protein FliL [Methylobacteriaceae bacterium]
MAKKAKPEAAEAEEGADAPPASGGGRKKLIIGALAVLVLAGGGGGYMFMKRSAAHPDAAHAEEQRKPVAFVDIQEMTVNLASEPNQERPRFLKFKVALEVKDAKVVPEVTPLLPRVQDIFQVFVRELRASDLEGSGGIYKLREELLRRVNIALAPTRVDAVLFKEVVIQ